MDELHHILSQLDIDELTQAHKNLCMDTNSTEKYISLEDLDKLLLQNVRSEFYKFNTQFEQILKFKPIRKITLYDIVIDLQISYSSLKSLRIDDRLFSCEDKIRMLELELDLKDYYDIKRPTIVFFSNPYYNSQSLNVTRYDILSETY